MNFVSRESQCFRDNVEGNIEIRGNKIHSSPRDQSLSDLLYSKTKQKQILKNALIPAKAVNISRVTVNCFPFDV